jgi:hypothetical protein
MTRNDLLHHLTLTFLVNSLPLPGSGSSRIGGTT